MVLIGLMGRLFTFVLPVVVLFVLDWGPRNQYPVCTLFLLKPF